MAFCSLTKNGVLVRRIMNAVKTLKQKDIAEEVGRSQQDVSYRIRKMYPQILDEMITILEMAGYEVVEKGGTKQ